MKLKKLCMSILISQFALSAIGQINSFIIPADTRLPKDSIVKQKLFNSLDTFIQDLTSPNSNNKYVLNSDILQTYILMDEIKDIQGSMSSVPGNQNKPFLTNVIRLSDKSFIIQFSYLNLEGVMPSLKASFTLEAKYDNDQFYFSSPLKTNTASWKSKIIDKTTVYFKNNMNDSNARKYFSAVYNFDKILNNSIDSAEFYCADNFHEVLQLVGVDYKRQYNGYAHNTLTENFKNLDLEVNGRLTSNFISFDPHDLWNDRLHKVLSIDVINKPVDEGTAYLYGGSWGLGWNEILKRFKIYAETNPSADWIALYNESKNFDEASKFPLNTDYVINALLVQEINKNKGFSTVIELLSCGKKEAGNENYFKALNKITGITKANFNSHVWTLIRSN